MFKPLLLCGFKKGTIPKMCKICVMSYFKLAFIWTVYMFGSRFLKSWFIASFTHCNHSHNKNSTTVLPKPSRDVKNCPSQTSMPFLQQKGNTGERTRKDWRCGYFFKLVNQSQSVTYLQMICFKNKNCYK